MKNDPIKTMVQAIKESGFSYRKLNRLTGIADTYLETFVREERWGSLIFPDDFVSLCKALQLSADDILGLQTPSV